MNLERARILLSKLAIKDRERNVSVPFKLNPNQLKAHRIAQSSYDKYKWLRLIILKARRVGMSSWVDGLAHCHCLARAQAHAMIVAHLKEVSEKGLFRVPRDLATSLNEHMPGSCEIFAKSIVYPHTSGNSNLDIATAGSVGAGRGMTLTFLHLSEAAQYPGQGSFLSILPAVSKAPDTVIALESTAQGRTGPGETFYEYWNAAHKTGASWNGYTPIFLSWLDDPACRRDDLEAEDAPASDLEKELMSKPYNADAGQIAWMRMVLEGECRGSEQMFAQEYPWDATVAFVATGDPAFTPAEMKYVISTREKPLKRGHFIREGKGARFIEKQGGKTWLYEEAQNRAWYYIGVDCARGMENATGRATGDFSAFVVVNGSTGDIAARYDDWEVDPRGMANNIDAAGRYFNNAMMNIELTGNLGLWCQQVLRDEYMYPVWYVWKGKDDKVPGKQKSHALGFETQARTRDLLFSTLRGKVHEGMQNIPGGLRVKDQEIIRQMDLMTMSTGMRWEVEKGHDDVFTATCLAIIACSQYPPPNILNFKGNTMEKTASNPFEFLSPKQELTHALASDQRFIMKKTMDQTTIPFSIRGI